MWFDKLSSRAVGAFPLSIATSLALEGAIGNHPDHPTKKNVLPDYESLWVNLRTLYRNMFNAVDKDDDPLRISPEDYAQALLQEMEVLRNVVTEYSQQRCKVNFYYSDYAKVEKLHKGAVVRMDNTDKQKAYTAHLIKVFKAFFDLTKQGENLTHMTDDLITAEEKTKALIFTHYPYDLLAARQFHELTLLESHTGALKKKSLWYTKYHEGKELPMIPFNRMFLQVFGDKETFRPMDIKLRREVMAIATKYKWHSGTTMDMINYGLSQMKNHYAYDLIRHLRK